MINQAVTYIKSNPAADNPYTNLYHAMAVHRLFTALLAEELKYLGYETPSEILTDEQLQEVELAVMFLSFVNPPEAYRQYCLDTNTEFSPMVLYYTTVLQDSVITLPASEILDCLHDAFYLKDLVENDATHVMENYRKEKLDQYQRVRSYQGCYDDLKDKMDNFQPKSVAGSQLWSQGKETYLKNLLAYMELHAG